MALLGGIDAARNNLNIASNSYADIQKQLDRYNKVFEAYSMASPETQIRAASVMRQAINEYNGLKKQQEENAIKIYKAQQRLDYYNSRQAQLQQPSLVQNKTSETPSNVVSAMPTETVPVVATATPGKLNNNTPTTNVELNALDTNQTLNASTTPTVSSSNINPTTPVGVSNIINSQTPKYPNTTIKPTNTKPTNNSVVRPNYGPGSVATTPGTGNIATINTPINTGRKNNVGKSFGNHTRIRTPYLYNNL